MPCAPDAPTVGRVSSRLTALTVDALDPARLSLFWAAMLGRDVADEPGGARLLAGADGQLGLRFAQARSAKAGRNRMHPHLTSTSAADQARTVARARELGATHLDVGQLPEEGHVVLADPEGNELCVLEPDAPFTAGCGFLGELNGVGTREVGLFWARALGWSLVWDRDGETAIQAPGGGTKLSWDGPPVPARQGRNRHRFDLAVPGRELHDEVARLTALGATPLGDVDGGLELADPDGNEFTLRPRG